MLISRGFTMFKYIKQLQRRGFLVLTNKTMKTSSMNQSHVQYLDRPQGNQIAYRQTLGSKSPGVIFLSGYMSNMNGQKAKMMEAYCEQHGHSFVRFDYQGCGESRDDLPSDSKVFDVWKADAEAILNQLTEGPQILVGSSLGGAIMLLLALEYPSRVQALLGIATAAVRFDKSVTYTEDKVNQVNSNDVETESYAIPGDFMDKQYQTRLLSNKIPITQPVSLIHGMQDDTVPYQISVNLAQRLQSDHVDVILRKEGQHRMSEELDLKLLTQCLHNLISRTSASKL